MLTKQQLDVQVWRAVWTRDRNGGVIIKHLKVVVNSLMAKIAYGVNGDGEDLQPLTHLTLNK